jgi:hypothetical protein
MFPPLTKPNISLQGPSYPSSFSNENVPLLECCMLLYLGLVEAPKKLSYLGQLCLLHYWRNDNIEKKFPLEKSLP